MEINGVAHIALTVNRFELCAPFYKDVLGFFGMQLVYENENHLYFVGGKTAVGITRCERKFKSECFAQGRIGLHHICFRAKERQHVDEAHRYLCQINATVIRPPEDGPWGPGYYSFLFEDPDGIRIELNHVPGKGLLEKGAEFNPSKDYA